MASISSGLDVEPLLQSILNSAVSLIHATHGTIGLLIKHDGERFIRTVAAHNMPPEELGAEMRAGEGLAGRVLEEDRTVLLVRYGELPNPTLSELLNHSVIGVPIHWGEELIGFFGIGSESPNQLNARDAEALELFAQYAAVAIHNAKLFETSQLALDQMRLLYDTSQRIGLATSVDEVTAAYFDQLSHHSQFVCNVCLYEFDADGQRTYVVVRGRWVPDEGTQILNERFPYSRDNLDPLLDAGETVTIADVRSDPRVETELRQIQEGSGRFALAMIPLIVRGVRIGLVVLSHSGVFEWSEAGLRPYQTTATQLAAAIDSRTQQSLLYERGQQLAVLQERHRLARELHDSVTQLIFSSTLIAQSIAPAWNRDPLEGQRRVNRLLELSQAALREMRSLLFELRPPGESAEGDSFPALTGQERVRNHGFPEALRLLAHDFSHDGIQVQVKATTTLSNGNEAQPVLAESLYRIAQEALSNAVKHAQARKIQIRLERGRDNELCFSVNDDGIGFSTSEIAGESETGGYGMTTMRERAATLGGSMHVVSRPGEGTTIEVTIPHKEAGK